MNRKRTTAAGAAVLLGLSTLGGAASLPQASATSAPGDLHVRHFTSTTLKETAMGQNGFVGTDVVRANGKVIGYNSLSGRFLAKKNRIVVRLGIALRGGVIMGRVAANEPAEGEDIRFRGPILGGSGFYDGISGRIVAFVPGDDTEGRAQVTLRWRR
ncbi:MAG: hypothetical protein ACXWDI_11965 [Nocardioides sp.]